MSKYNNIIIIIKYNITYMIINYYRNIDKRAIRFIILIHNWNGISFPISTKQVNNIALYYYNNRYV